MKAIVVEQPGGVEQLKLSDYPIPKPADNELLIRVVATAINRADIGKRTGNYPTKVNTNIILGLELSGIVAEVGENCVGWNVGDRVFGLIAEGGYAEYAVIPSDMAIPIPGNLSFEEAAAIPQVFLTAYQTLFWQGSLQKDQWILIHAGASGVGTAAIQLAKQVGAKVIVTAGSEEKLSFCRDFGADIGINYKQDAFDTRVLEATQNQGVNLILDFIGASYWKQNINCLGIDGKLILAGALGGMQVESIDLSPLFAKRIQVIGTLLGPRSKEYKVQLTHEFSQTFLPLFEKGILKSIIDRVYPLEEVKEAHIRMEESRNTGKIILKVAP